MALGQVGPPASAKQIQYLQALMRKAGHETFRDARRPLGLTQRQASGKFTMSEASALIDRLASGSIGADGELEGQMALTGEEIAADRRIEAERIEIARGIPADILAAELERRGWSVNPPG
jgi:hypothetical protein